MASKGSGAVVGVSSGVMVACLMSFAQFETQLMLLAASSVIQTIYICKDDPVLALASLSM